MRKCTQCLCAASSLRVRGFSLGVQASCLKRALREYLLGTGRCAKAGERAPWIVGSNAPCDSDINKGDRSLCEGQAPQEKAADEKGWTRAR